MSFQTITMNNASGVPFTFSETQTGLYVLNGLPFGAPLNAVKISPGKRQGPSGPVNFSVTRFVEFAPLETGKIPKLSIAANCSVPNEANTGMVDDCVAGLSSWLTEAIIRDLLMGRS